jgi:hypothetical protein
VVDPIVVATEREQLTATVDRVRMMAVRSGREHAATSIRQGAR